MYNSRPNLMLGFHGCDESTRNQLVQNPDSVKRSQEIFDWLGNGFYIWENNYERASKWTKDKKKRNKLSKPSVLGVVYQLNHCLDFTDSAFIDIISEYYSLMKADFSFLKKDLPKNKDLLKDEYHDLILRELDCAVIEYMHQKIAEKIESDIASTGNSELKHFDTTREVYLQKEGPLLKAQEFNLKITSKSVSEI